MSNMHLNKQVLTDEVPFGVIARRTCTQKESKRRRLLVSFFFPSEVEKKESAS